MPRFDRSLPASFVFCALAILGLACAGGSSGSSGGNGGSAESGGSTGSGGALATGGVKGSGGATTGTGGVTGKGGATGTGGATAMGGATGTGGTSSACANCSLMISSECQTGSSTTEIKVTVDVQDALISPLPLANVTFRYWFVIGGSDTPMLSIDYAQISQMGTTIVGTFVPVSPALTGANEYLEVSFGGTVPMLTLFGDTGQIQLHLHTASYSSFDPNPTSDYSYRPCAGGDTGTTFSAAPTITGYVNGQLVWGTEPQ
jgi:hypothetical protein